jgi:hypothetical protein
MRVVCAWCGQMLKEGRGPVSHGICLRCARRFEASFASRRRTVRAETATPAGTRV